MRQFSDKNRKYKFLHLTQILVYVNTVYQSKKIEEIIVKLLEEVTFREFPFSTVHRILQLTGASMKFSGVWWISVTQLLTNMNFPKRLRNFSEEYFYNFPSAWADREICIEVYTALILLKKFKK